LWSAVILLLAVWAARTLVGDIYRVESASMLPTLGLGGEGGELVLVTYDRSPPERFELVVLYRAGESVPEVKRVVGLPRESVRLRHGDLWVDGEAFDAPQDAPEWIPIFGAGNAVEEHFTMERSDEPPDGGEAAVPQAQEVAGQRPWSRDGGGWRLAALDVPLGSGRGLMRHHKGLHDGYRDLSGDIVLGRGEAGDGRLRVRAAVEELAADGGRLRLGLLKAGDTFEFALDLKDTEQGALLVEATLTQRWSGERQHGEGQAIIKPGAALELTLSLRNRTLIGSLKADSGGEIMLFSRVSEEHEHPLTQRGETHGERRTYGAHPWLGGEGLVATFNSIRLERDLAWTSRGSVGVSRPVLLGPDEIFVLGDNSRVSRDSREWGAVPLAAVLGRPRAVLWPPRALRLLP
jgi:signal peptidase I